MGAVLRLAAPAAMRRYRRKILPRDLHISQFSAIRPVLTGSVQQPTPGKLSKVMSIRDIPI
jgi:hypothetical protein